VIGGNNEVECREPADVLMFVQLLADVFQKSSLLLCSVAWAIIVGIKCLSTLLSLQPPVELYWRILEKLPEYFKDTMDWFMG